MTIDPTLIDVVHSVESGYPAEKQAEDTRDALMMAATEAGAIVTDFPSHLWIEPNDWGDAAHDCDLYHTWPID